MNDKNNPKLLNSVKRPIIVVIVGVIAYHIVANFDVVFGYLKEFLDILSPVFIGIAIAFIANMPMRFLEKRVFKKWKISPAKRITCLMLALVFILLVLDAIVLLIIPRLAESVSMLATNLEVYLNRLVSWADGTWRSFEFSAETVQIIQEYAQVLLTNLDSLITNVLNYVMKLTVGVISFVVDFVLAFVICFYLLYNKEKFIFQSKKLVVTLFKNDRAERILDIGTLTNKSLNDYFYGMILECTILGLMCFISMKIFDFPYALLISVFVGITQIVPIIGPWISGIIGVLIVLMVDPTKALWFAVDIIIVQQLEANLVYPRVVGKAVGLSGIWVMIAVLLGGGLFGLTGIILCVPIMAVLYTLISQWVNARLKVRREEVDAMDLVDDDTQEFMNAQARRENRKNKKGRPRRRKHDFDFSMPRPNKKEKPDDTADE